MKEAGEYAPGSMAAILGLDIPTVEGVCKKASIEREIVQVANDNCPGQVVVSGDNAALERLIPLAGEAGARKVTRLKVSIAAHSPLMARAQKAFNQAVEAAPLRKPQIPIVGNLTGIALTRVRDIEDDLEAQLTSRVRWTESMQYIFDQRVTTFLEFGSGKVLCGLLKRVKRKAKGIPLGTPSDYEKLEV